MNRKRKDKLKAEHRVIEVDSRLYEQFSENEIAEYKEAFCFFDPKGRGFISKEDLNVILLTTGKYILDVDRELILKDVGHVKEEDEIDFNTFLRCMLHTTVEQPDNKSDIKECFMSLKDENDDIPIDKFKHVMTNLLNKLSIEEVNGILKMVPITQKVKTVKLKDKTMEENEVEYSVIDEEDKLYELMITKRY